MADYGLGSRVRACRLSSQLPELWPEGSHAATATSPEAAPLCLVMPLPPPPPAPHLSGSPTPRPSAGSVPTLG